MTDPAFSVLDYITFPDLYTQQPSLVHQIEACLVPFLTWTLKDEITDCWEDTIQMYGVMGRRSCCKVVSIRSQGEVL